MTAEYRTVDGTILHKGELLLHVGAGHNVLIGGQTYVVTDASTVRGEDGRLVRFLIVAET